MYFTRSDYGYIKKPRDFHEVLNILNSVLHIK